MYIKHYNNIEGMSIGNTKNFKKSAVMWFE